MNKILRYTAVFLMLVILLLSVSCSPVATCEKRCQECGKCTDELCELCEEKCKCERPEGCEHLAGSDGVCKLCGEELDGYGFTAEKSVDVSEGVTLYPAHALTYCDTVYRGARVKYTITISNSGKVDTEFTITDTVKAGTRLVSGGDRLSGDVISWSATLKPGESKALVYTIEVTAKDGEEKVVKGDGAVINGTRAKCYDLYIENTLNEKDQARISLATRILSKSDYVGFDFVKRACTMAFTRNVDFIVRMGDKDIDAYYSGILNGSAPDELLASVVPGFFGGEVTGDGLNGERNGALAVDDLIYGDLILIKKDGGVRLYVFDGATSFDVTEKAKAVDSIELISSLGSADGYIALRPSVSINDRTPLNPDLVPESLNEYQKALVNTAYAYLIRGESLQYDDTRFGLNTKTGEYRWEIGSYNPEDYTYTEWGYLNCAAFTYDIYLAALGYTLPSQMYTTANLTSYADDNGMRVFYFERERADVYTKEEEARIEAEFMATIKPGDILVRRHTNPSTNTTSGHAMLYIGNGLIIHSGGSNYSKTSGGVGYEIYEPTIRMVSVHDYFFTGNTSMFNDEANIISVVRPLEKFDGEIPENTKNRENLHGVRVDLISSAASSVTVNRGGVIVYSYEIFNTNDYPVTITIHAELPEGTEYNGGAEALDGKTLVWQVEVKPLETKTVEFAVTVKSDLDYGTPISLVNSTVNGVSFRCPTVYVNRTLDEGEAERLSETVEAMRSEGTTLTGLALVNEIYKRAFGTEDIFLSTDADEVMEGSDGVFTKSAVTYSGKTLTMLRSTESYYSKMLVNRLYGGMRFYSNGKLGDRTKQIKAQNLVVGDILIGRTSSSVNVYIYMGNATYVSLNSGFADVNDFTTVNERVLYFGRDFAVLRPSFIME